MVDMVEPYDIIIVDRTGRFHYCKQYPSRPDFFISKCGRTLTFRNWERDITPINRRAMRLENLEDGKQVFECLECDYWFREDDRLEGLKEGTII